MAKIKQFFNSIGTWIGNILNKIGKFFGKILRPIKDFLAKIFRPVTNLFDKISNWVKDHIQYRKRQAIWGIVFVLPLMIGFIYFFFIPFVTTVIYSFSFVDTTTNKVTWIGLANYKYIFTQHASFLEELVASILEIALDVPIILIFSLLMAVILNTKFKARGLVRGIFFMPVIFNSQAIDVAMSASTSLQGAIDATTQDLFAMMFSLEEFFLNANIPSTFVGYLTGAVQKIYEIVSFSGVQILIFLSGIQSVPKHLYEAAKIEGATQYEIFWKITFPMVSPLMLTAAVYTVVDAFLRSPILKLLKDHDKPGTISQFEHLSYYGVHAAMSWVYALAVLLILGIVMLILSRMVFYYDE